MNPTAEAHFECNLNVSGPVSLDVSIDSGFVRVQSGKYGIVTVRGTVRAYPSMLQWGDPEEQVRRLAANPPVWQEQNAIRIGDSPSRSRQASTLAPTQVQSSSRRLWRRRFTRAVTQARFALRPPKTADTTSTVRTNSGRVDIAGLTGPTSESRETVGAIRGGGSVLDIETDSGEIQVL